MFIPNYVLATKGQRFLNFVLDRIIFYIFLFLLGLFLAIIAEITDNYEMLSWMDDINPIQDFLMTTLLILLYYFVFEYAFGRTIGKFITGTMVISKDQNELTATQIAFRTLSRIIPFEPFSMLGEPTIGWHDSNADSFVVDVKKYKMELQTIKRKQEDELKSE